MLFFWQASFAESSETCHRWPSWFKPACQRLYNTWTKGEKELYLSGYAWHNRYRYTPEKIASYNEAAWGGGLGKSYYDEKGDWSGFYAFGFLDSHKNIEPAIGYAYLKVAHLNEKAHVGLGYTVLVTARPDILNGIPFPGLLPWASIGYGKASICVTYIPGAQNIGNVLFIVGKYLF